MNKPSRTEFEILRNGIWHPESRPLPLTLANVRLPSDKDQDARVESARALLLEQHADQLQTIVAEAREQGYGEGKERAQQEYAEKLRVRLEELEAQSTAKVEELKSQCDQLAAVIEAITNERHEMAREMEAVSVQVAFCALTRILGDASRHKDHLQALVRSASQAAGESGPLRIRLARRDYVALFEPPIPTDALVDINKQLDFVADDSLSPGSCLVETSRGSLDASLATQLGTLKELLLNVYLDSRELHE